MSALVAFLLTSASALGSTRIRPHRPPAPESQCPTLALTSDGIPQTGTIHSQGACQLVQYELFGLAGNELTITLDTIGGTPSVPYLDLEPPPGDDAITPSPYGGKSITLNYVLTSTGNWTINVGTTDQTGSLDYRLRAFSHPVDYSGNCEPQPAACGQSWTWSITPTSCSFSDTGAAYAPFYLYLDQGDRVKLDVGSADYDPGVVLWRTDEHGYPVGNPVASDYGPFAHLTYNVKTLGLYMIGSYDSTMDGYGQFSLDITCNTICTPVSIAEHPPSETVSGGPINLAVTVLGAGPFTYQWFEGETGDVHHLVGSQATLHLDAVAAPTSYWVRVRNACSRADSNVARVNVVAPGKRRISGHS